MPVFPCVRLWCHDFADGVALPVPLESMAISPITRAIPDNLSDLVGGTPMVRLARLAPDCDAELVGKLEAYNPAGSVKDRIGVAMIEGTEAQGVIVARCPPVAVSRVACSVQVGHAEIAPAPLRGAAGGVVSRRGYPALRPQGYLGSDFVTASPAPGGEQAGRRRMPWRPCLRCGPLILTRSTVRRRRRMP